MMDFITHNDEKIDAMDTSYKGCLDVSFSTLVDIFGPPSIADEFKVDAQWLIKFEDGLVATIYNWKNGRNYRQQSGLDVEDIKDWNVGGKKEEVVDRINSILGLICSEDDSSTNIKKLSTRIEENATKRDILEGMMTTFLTDGWMHIDKAEIISDNQILLYGRYSIKQYKLTIEDYEGENQCVE